VIAEPPAGHARAKFWLASAALRSGNPALAGTRGLMPSVFGVVVMDWWRSSEAEKQENNMDDTICRPKLSERFNNMERKTMKTQIVARAEIFREGDLSVGVCPDLEVSSFGETVAEARQSLREALEAFVQACEQMGTLTEVLEEAGFAQENQNWMPRQPIAAELVAVG